MASERKPKNKIRRKSKSGKRKAGVGCLGCFGLIWMGFVLAMDGLVGYGFWRAYDAEARYLTTTGVIVSSTVRRSASSDGTTYSAEVEYDYLMNGQSYRGDRASFFTFGTSSHQHAQATVDRYPVGREVAVYADPDDPSESVLDMTTASFPWFSIIFLTPFHCIGITFLGGGVLQAFRERRLGDDAVLAGLVGRQSHRQGCARLVLHDSHWSGWVVFMSVLGGTTFIAVFVVAFGFGVDASRQTVLGIWGGCLSLALLLPTLLRIRRASKSMHLMIDWHADRFTRKPDSIGVPIADVRTIRLESKDTGTQVNKQPWLTHTLTAVDDAGEEHLLLIAKGYASRGNDLREWFAARFEAASKGSADEDPPSMPVASKVEINQTKS